MTSIVEFNIVQINCLLIMSSLGLLVVSWFGETQFALVCLATSKKVKPTLKIYIRSE